METGTHNFDNVVHGFETLYMDFSKLMLAEVHTFQHAAVTKIRIRENALAYQTTKMKRKEKERKTLLREKEQEIEARENSRITLAEAIKEAVAEFPLE